MLEQLCTTGYMAQGIRAVLNWWMRPALLQECWLVRKLTDEVEADDKPEHSQMESEVQLRGAQAKLKVRVA